jgi:hypothetical protein
VAVPPLVVVVVVAMLQEAVALLVLLVRPSFHHVVEPCNGLGLVAAKISKESLVGDAVVEAVDDVLLGDVGDGGASVKEAAIVGSQELLMFLFALRQNMMSTCSSDRPLEVVGEDSFKIILRVDEVFPEAFQPREGSGLQGHRDVDDLDGVEAARDFHGCGVAPEPPMGSLLVIILGDADRFEALRVLVQAESAHEHREAITVI